MMKFLSPLAIAGALLSLSCLGAAPAQALSLVTFVSGKGIDTGTCADSAHPCRSFQFAVNRTIAFGEVKALDPANYGAMVITKSISISGVEGAGINLTTGDAIEINAGPNDVVNLSHLTIDGLKTATYGITLGRAGSLTITHCVIRNFVQIGVLLVPDEAVKFLIGDTLVSDNTNIGIFVAPTAPAVLAVGTLDHVLMYKNGTGIRVNASGSLGSAIVYSVDSLATNNTDVGFQALAGAVLSLSHSVAQGQGFNNVGVKISPDSTGFSNGNNSIFGISGTLQKVGTQ